ncbi:hypothetical protein P5673_029235 [Acropora cervicornis]|uniref:Uncharacterized protein n=1 Tax=Acropora cervicornis TaxID=6130 RepID=A0AAD9PW64_ACRCE|nr:hypothetical protein P5673_029235 [Acropora cervicornis]
MDALTRIIHQKTSREFSITEKVGKLLFEKGIVQLERDPANCCVGSFHVVESIDELRIQTKDRLSYVIDIAASDTD